MKITVTVDCTPEEARTFLGFPNLEKIQTVLLEEMQKRVTTGLSAAETDELFKLWMPAANKNWQDLQSMFWPGMSGNAGDKSDKT